MRRIRLILSDRCNERTEGVKEVQSPFSLERNDLTACATDVGVDIEGLPQVVDGCRTRHRTNVKQDADVGLQYRAEGIEEPAMRVDLLLILLLQAEDELDRHSTALCALNLHGRCNGD